MLDSEAWQCRYLSAGDDKWELLTADIDLVKYFGASGMSAMPGASIYLKNGGHVKMDAASWNWLRPLLEELQGFRKKASNTILRSNDGEEIPTKEGKSREEKSRPVQTAEEAEETGGETSTQVGSDAGGPELAESSV